MLLTISSRRLASAGALVVLALLSACKVDVNSRLAEDDANELVDVLYSEEIAATKERRDDGMYAVRVEEQELQRAIRTMRSHGLPRPSYASMGELFKKEGMISSPSEERMRYVHAVSQELARTLSQIDGVTSARVHPVIPFNDPLADRIKPSSVSVFIKHRHEANLQVLGPAIKNLVLRSIEGLRDDNISLTFIPTAAVAPPPPHVDKPPPGWQWVLIGTLSMLLAGMASVLAYMVLRSRNRNVVFSTNDAGAAPASPSGGIKGWWARRNKTDAPVTQPPVTRPATGAVM